jgi:microcystin-dependent protein
MSQPFIGEIRIFAGNFAPAGWAFCDGALLDIATFDTLFNLIGTTYGGDGQSNFAVPNLQGRIVLHQGTGFTLGQSGGVETVTLTTNQIPGHSHSYSAPLATVANAAAPDATTIPAQVQLGAASWKSSSLANQTLTMGTPALNSLTASDGGSQPHENMAPFLTVSYIISLFGVYPSP